MISEPALVNEPRLTDTLSSGGVERILTALERALEQTVPELPESLYDPVRYILSAGGKRVRPLLTALSAEACGATAQEMWIGPAVAIELLHTFTLVHDDIMDKAESRRGKPTVHIAFGNDAAILSGDVLIALALEALAQHPSRSRELLAEFSLGFRHVCEGQALDKAFELRYDISLGDYEEMIMLKTSSIFELAATLGSEAAGGEHTEALRTFARHTGLAFQMLDDLLDLTADHTAFGKTIGGDILEGKRTFLYIETMQRYGALTTSEQAVMNRVAEHLATSDDITAARSLMERAGVLSRTRAMIATETARAEEALRMANGIACGELLEFSRALLGRVR